MAVVTDHAGKLLGTVTDGDIRRAIIHDIKLTESVAKIMNISPLTASHNCDKKKLLEVMTERAMIIVPIVDEANRVTGLFDIHHLLNREKHRSNPVVIMAGGLGSRLSELTKDIPKPMLKVGNTPLLEHAINHLSEFGFKNIYLAVNYKAGVIKEHFGNGKKWNISIEYLHEEQKLGTAGALSLLPEISEEPFLVLNGDLLTNVDFDSLLKFHTDHEAFATMCVSRYEIQVPYGVAQFQGHRLLGVEEKPIQQFFINAGIYVFDPAVLKLVPKNQYFDITSLFDLIQKNQMEAAVFPIREQWIDIGQIEDFKRAQRQMIET